MSGLTHNLDALGAQRTIDRAAAAAARAVTQERIAVIVWVPLVGEALEPLRLQKVKATVSAPEVRAVTILTADDAAANGSSRLTNTLSASVMPVTVNPCCAHRLAATAAGVSSAE